jgi:hypothetical protein
MPDGAFNGGARTADLWLNPGEQGAISLRSGPHRLAERCAHRDMKRAQNSGKVVQRPDFTCQIILAYQAGLPLKPFPSRVAEQSPR